MTTAKNKPHAQKRILVALSGASGMPYAKRFIEVLSQKLNSPPDLILSEIAEQILKHEERIDRYFFQKIGCNIFENKNFYTPPASGSSFYDAMVIVPCSMCSVGKIANGIADDLLSRAADVSIKEGRKLILVPRETPFSTIHLENLTTLSRLGVCIIPPNPGFYHHPETISDLVDFVVDRILMQLNLPYRLLTEWGRETT